MLAELHYSNTLLSVVMADIKKVLTGSTSVGSLSAEAQAGNSTLTGAAGTWVDQGDTTVVTDIGLTVSYIYNANAIVVKQPCSTNPSKFKYLKFALASFAGAGNNTTLKKDLTWVGALAGACTGTTLSGINYKTRTFNGMSTAAVVTDSLVNFTSSATVTVTSLVVKIAVTPTTTAIAVGRNGLTLVNTFTSFDIPEDWLPAAASTNFLPCIFFGSNASSTAGADLLDLSVCPFTYAGALYGGIQNTTSVYFKLGFSKYILNTLFTSSDYKFADFKSTGTQYTMFPITLASANINTDTSVGGNILYIGSFERDYPAISSVAFGCHLLAFGKTGDVTSTSLGNFCKFDNYMIKVQ